MSIETFDEIRFDPEGGAQRFRLELDGKQFRLTFFFVRASGSWYFHIDDSVGERLVSGVRLVSWYPLADRLKYLAGMWTDSDLVVIPPADAFYTDPGRDELGDTHRLMRLKLAELET